MKQPSNYELGIDIALKPDQWKKLDKVKRDIQGTAQSATTGLYALGGSLLILSAVLYKRSRRG